MVNMNQALTPKQKIVLSQFRELQEKLNHSPTLEELRQALGYPHVSAVQRHVDALKEKGYLAAAKHHKRSLELLHQHLVNIPLVGNVACGMPLLAEENVEAYVPYEADKLHGASDDYFFLRAVGDSMNKTGIDDGDLVLVKQQQVSEPGKNVVALVGDDATIKRLVMEDGYWVLQPVSSNPAHKKLIMVEDFAIQGVAVDVVKTGEATNGARITPT
jgi:repressor LexA